MERRIAALTQLTVADVATPVLSRDAAHHLFKVLRATEGEEIVLTDARGSWTFASVGPQSIARTTEVFVDPVEVPVTLYIAPLKGDRSELVIAKATELGVTHIVPLLSERVVVKFKGDARDKAVARWRRISDEALGQCRRTYAVTFENPVTPAEVPAHVAISDFGSSEGLGGITAIAVGPEGGWGPKEWGATRTRVGFGPTVLRAETAGLVAATLLVSNRAGWSRHGAASANG
jgi:16S rRNA (uracil1498-N3)-methyltransferase